MTSIDIEKIQKAGYLKEGETITDLVVHAYGRYATETDSKAWGR